MKLLAAPGQIVGPEGEGLVSIYDPKRLQARVDVPLASMAGVREGQEVEIRSEVVAGRVTRKIMRPVNSGASAASTPACVPSNSSTVQLSAIAAQASHFALTGTARSDSQAASVGPKRGWFRIL